MTTSNNSIFTDDFLASIACYGGHAWRAVSIAEKREEALVMPMMQTVLEILFPRAGADKARIQEDKHVALDDGAERWIAEATQALAHDELAVALCKCASENIRVSTATAVVGEAMQHDLEWTFIGTDGHVYDIWLDEPENGAFPVRVQRTKSPDEPCLLDVLTQGAPHRGIVTRRFRLMRDVDVSGVSGTGHVADGEVMRDGRVVVAWRGEWPTITVHPSMASVEAVHLHGGATRIEDA